MALSKKAENFIQSISGQSLAEKLAEAGDPQLFYELSEARGNIVEWLAIEPGSKVLLLGNDSKAIADRLTEKQVCLTECEDPAQLSDLSEFAYVIAFHPLQLYGMKAFTAFVRELKAGTRLVLIESNRMALRNWNGYRSTAGCAASADTPLLFAEFQTGYADRDKRKYSGPEISRWLKSLAVSTERVYYPYPDEIYMKALYSDARLPKVGELGNPLGSMDADNTYLFLQQTMDDSVIADGQYPYFASAFVYCSVITGGGMPKNCETNAAAAGSVVYVKSNAERREPYRIATEGLLENGQLIYRKRPLTPAAADFLRQVQKNRDVLEAICAPHGFHVAESEIREDGCLYMENLKGQTFEEYLDGLLKDGGPAQVTDAIRSMLQRIMLRDASVIDIDMIFANIICMDDGRFGVIDYEWTDRVEELKKHVCDPWKYVVYRIVDCYIGQNEKRVDLNREAILADQGITAEMEEEFRTFEKTFQEEKYDPTLSSYRFKVNLNTKNRRFPGEYVTREEVSAMQFELEGIKSTRWWRFRRFFVKLLKGKHE